MAIEKILYLQLFAEGGTGNGTTGESGGEGSPGENVAVDAGRQRLLELGVPADKLRKGAKYQTQTPKSAAAVAQNDESNDTEEQSPSAKDPVEENKEEKPKKPTFKELMEDPEYNAEMQAIVRERLRNAKIEEKQLSNAKKAEEKLAKLAPAIELIARKYGLDTDDVDFELLAKAVEEDESYYENKALEMGVPVSIAKKIDMDERSSARAKKEQERAIEDQKIRDHFQSLNDQGREMRKIFPNFDLDKELQNPAFFRMTSPNIGISVEDAYYAIHRKEIQSAAMEATAKKTAEKLSNSIQAGQRRPTENGISSQAPSTTSFNYARATPEQREAFKKQLREQWARGKKVYPGR